MARLFDERKVTEAAAYLLRLRGGTMSYIKLLKLLYIADRQALGRWGIPLSNDNYVSMDHGPVLSKTYNLIRDGGSRHWSEHISAPSNYEISLVRTPETLKLSLAEEKLLDEIFGHFGQISRWDLVDTTHKFPEWRDPQGSSIPITIREILHALGEDEAGIEHIIAELDHEREVSEKLGVSC